MKLQFLPEIESGGNNALFPIPRDITLCPKEYNRTVQLLHDVFN